MVAPILSSSLLAVIIDCCSNTIAQHLKAWKNGVPLVFDWTLFMHFALFACLTAPLNYLWQNWLERTFPGWKLERRAHNDQHVDLENLGASKEGRDEEDRSRDIGDANTFRVRDWKNIGKKWFTDCITLGALFNTVAFLVIMGVFKHKSFASIGLDLRKETFKIIFDSYKVWPIANIISTTYVPVERRIVFLSCCGLLWNIYLSLVAARL
ncbi:hypothetical protein LTS18_007194 [Coniosporium uncinatum]|uniref:Uncharacterized protein n=1 Tax=Coniosporium uncinatum TaxID=93489 RepID=A0ACC3DPV4_9PEZI|nr:hypothetical protein LTS18_007194 [Coniosporium uncinatum]